MKKTIKIANKVFSLDKIQYNIALRCSVIAKMINRRKMMNGLFKLFLSQPKFCGVYMHGQVGRGKTMLMNYFASKLKIKHEVIHFQKFMQQIHELVKKYNNQPSDKVIENLADEIKAKYPVLCLDEFEINDISDAMLIGRLIEELSKRGVFIFLTTNTIADNLYMGGIQRESFMPYIEFIKNNFEEIYINSENDYRYLHLSSEDKRYFYPINGKSDEEIKKIIEKFSKDDKIESGEVDLFGRITEFKKTVGNALITDFDELIDRDLSYNDYVKICQKYQIVVLRNLRKFDDNENDLAIRFINFIDNAYYYKVLLIIESNCNYDELYDGAKKKKEFTRTISRINEMQTTNYG